MEIMRPALADTIAPVTEPGRTRGDSADNAAPAPAAHKENVAMPVITFIRNSLCLSVNYNTIPTDKKGDFIIRRVARPFSDL
jgi:hypothetical protein